MTSAAAHVFAQELRPDALRSIEDRTPFSRYLPDQRRGKAKTEPVDDKNPVVKREVKPKFGGGMSMLFPPVQVKQESADISGSRTPVASGSTTPIASVFNKKAVITVPDAIEIEDDEDDVQVVDDEPEFWERRPAPSAPKHQSRRDHFHLVPPGGTAQFLLTINGGRCWQKNNLAHRLSSYK